MTPAALEVVLPLDQIPMDQMRRVVVDELAICVAHTRDGGWYAIDDTCTHEDCSLSEGELSDHLVECPCHGSRFDLRTGDVLNLPAVLPVHTHRVVVVGDQLRLELDAVDTA
ncbi:MAG: non-heme iron oxygenase ferredoxin subunit [Candidatus Dormibacteria bacterium]